VGVPGTLTRARRRTRPSLLRGLSGLCTGGLAALALVLVVGWFYADHTGLPGPGIGMLIGHVAAAAAAVVAQVWADRRPDRLGTLAAVALAALIVGGLALAWLF
jgi:hypothetical protein